MDFSIKDFLTTKFGYGTSLDQKWTRFLERTWKIERFYFNTSQEGKNRQYMLLRSLEPGYQLNLRDDSGFFNGLVIGDRVEIELDWGVAWPDIAFKSPGENNSLPLNFFSLKILK